MDSLEKTRNQENIEMNPQINIIYTFIFTIELKSNMLCLDNSNAKQDYLVSVNANVDTAQLETGETDVDRHHSDKIEAASPAPKIQSIE
jgi:hypothetical protein